ncbi:MAG: carboxypeptidase-like regulatory domain-containing protein [Candidatus Sumerlaeia bacterium]|nr:carboxypeptidase-like regulatory domain-containing protein [Candidatus Sumerlaeia bacterium]
MKNEAGRNAKLALGILGLVAAIAVLLVMLRGGGEQVATAPPPTATAAPSRTGAPTPPPAAAQTPAAQATPAERDRNAPPNPTPIPPADPMAEFRVERFTGFVVEAPLMQPIQGATVEATLFQGADLAVRDGYPAPLATVTTDSRGFFRFPERELGPNDTLAWRASKEGYSAAIMFFPGGQGLGDRLRSTLILKPGAVIGGMVTDPQGIPVGGATVGDARTRPLGIAGTVPTSQEPSSWTRTDAEGRFLLTGIESDEKIREVSLPVSAKGFLPRISPPLPVGTTDTLIVLTPSEASLRGMVYEADGSPAGGARVLATLRSGNVTDRATSLRTATTEADGSFAIGEMLAGAYQIDATRPAAEMLGRDGPSASVMVTVLRGDDNEVELRLAGSAMVEALFTDAESGRGVEGVTVFSPIDDVVVRETAAKAVTGADGRARFEVALANAVALGPLSFPIEFPEGYFPAEEGAVNATFAPGEIRIEGLSSAQTTTVEAALRRGFELKGEVIDVGGAPAANNPVHIVGERFFATLKTDAFGKFSTAVPSGERLKVEASTESGIANTVLRVDGPEEVRLELLPYASIEGVVYDSQGSPVADIVVRVQRDAGLETFKEALIFEEGALSQPDGAIVFAKIAPGAVTLAAMLPPSSFYVQTRPLALELAAGETRSGVRIDLEDAEYLEGYVRDGLSGEPVEGAAVLTDRSGIGGTSDAEGRFRIVGLEPNAVLAEVSAQAEGYQSQTRRNVTAYDTGLEFRLMPFGRLRVRVLDDGGSPVGEFRARLLKPGLRDDGRFTDVVGATVSTDGSGVWVVEGMEAGSYRLEVSGLRQGVGSAVEEFERLADGTPAEVQVRLEAGLALLGSVVEADTRAPAPGAVVRLLNPPSRDGIAPPPGAPGSYLETVADGAGAFRFEALPPGSYRLDARTDSAASDEAAYELAEGSAPAVLELQPAPRLYGSITGADGRPVRSATMFFLKDGRRQDGEPLTARGGEYDRRLPSAGSWTVAVSEDATGETTTRVAELAAGEERELDIDFSQQKLLRGAISVNGQPGANKDALILRRTDGAEVVLVPGSAGGNRYEARAFPGDYTVSFASDNATVPTGQVVNVPDSGDGSELDFEIPAGTAEVIVVPLSGAAPQGLKLRMETRNGGGESVLFEGFAVDRASIRFFRLPEGQYRVRVTRGSEELGVSDWAQVPGGGETTVVVEVP